VRFYSLARGPSDWDDGWVETTAYEEKRKHRYQASDVLPRPQKAFTVKMRLSVGNSSGSPPTITVLNSIKPQKNIQNPPTEVRTTSKTIYASRNFGKSDLLRLMIAKGRRIPTVLLLSKIHVEFCFVFTHELSKISPALLHFATALKEMKKTSKTGGRKTLDPNMGWTTVSVNSAGTASATSENSVQDLGTLDYLPTNDRLQKR
jgi:hypothetical protein